jgi:Ni/Co efflux regulator RcnB
MKKLLSIAALLLAFGPFSQAQAAPEELGAHPDARNDRQQEMHESHHAAVAHSRHHKARHHHHAKKHHRHAKHHHHAVKPAQ